MGVVIPAVIPTSYKDLEEKLSVLAAFPQIDAVQIDIVDGVFAKPASWPYGQEAGAFADAASKKQLLPHTGRFQYETDLMVIAPETIIGSWIAVGITRILVHAESTTRIDAMIADLKGVYGYDKEFAPGLLSFGLALNIDTDTALIEPYLADVDYVQFMGIATIGKQGLPFDERVLRKISEFRKRYPDILVQVDGGVSRKTAPALLCEGVKRLVVGSDLWKAPDMGAALAEFDTLVEKYGRYA